MSIVLSLFREGLNNRQSSKVAQAIAMGVDIKTSQAPSDPANPLITFLGKNAFWFLSPDKIPTTPSKIMAARNAVSEITDLLLEQPQDFKQAGPQGLNVADNILSSLTEEYEDHSNPAKVVIAALYDSLSSGEEAYHPDIAGILRGKTGFAREATHQNLQQVFDCVRLRLREPESQIERLLELKHEEETAAWLERLYVPSLKYLPAEPQVLTQANAAFIEATRKPAAAAIPARPYCAYKQTGMSGADGAALDSPLIP